MCIFCKSSESSKYAELIRKSLQEDALRLKNSVDFSKENSLIKCYSNCKMEIKTPLFEARTAYSVPQNYFQQLSLNGEKTGNMFAHGATRSVTIIAGKIYLLSKNVAIKDGLEFFSSYVLLEFDRNELLIKWENNNLTIGFRAKKSVKNLLNQQNEILEIEFNFISQDVKDRLVSKERIMTSSQVQSIYSKNLGGRMASVDIQGYGVTVPHFSPHPYLFQIKEELGFISNKEMQEKTVEYFRAHLH